MNLRAWVRCVLLGLARRLGTTLRDPRTGAVIGRALLIPWRGRILVIGLEQGVKPVFLPQDRQTYWKQELGFQELDEPDFPNERNP